MAKNIFVHEEYKRLREEVRRYKKAEQRLAPKLLAYAKEEKQFQTRDWTVFPRSTFLQEQYYLLKQRTMLEVEKKRLDQTKLSLQNRQSELEKQCQEHEAARKIETIAAGILRKNYKFVRQLEEIETRAKELIPRINHIKEQMKALKNRVACDKVNTRYRVTVSETLTNNQAASLIADAILFEPEAVQLIARSNGNNVLLSSLKKSLQLCLNISACLRRENTLLRFCDETLFSIYRRNLLRGVSPTLRNKLLCFRERDDRLKRT